MKPDPFDDYIEKQYAKIERQFEVMPKIILASKELLRKTSTLDNMSPDLIESWQTLFDLVEEYEKE